MKWQSAIDGNAHLARVRRFFSVKDGGKTILRKRAAAGALVITVMGCVIGGFVFKGGDDTSTLKKSNKPLTLDAGKAQGAQAAGGKVGSMLANSEHANEPGQREKSGRSGKVNFKAQQVLVSDGFDPSKTMPMGTNLIAKTLTTIDTRQADQLVKVLLPYGGRASAGGELPKNSVLFGQVTYRGKGEKVFIKFSKGVLPSGVEMQVEAQGLSSGDFSPGLVGRFHGNADMRVASTLGLTMVAGMSDVLTEKEAIGGGGLLPGSVTVKSTMKNALYHGISQVAQDESNRQAAAIAEEQEYVTVNAGTDLIVSLTKAYVEK
jgi:Bacterial conjugation TrbI-like protein